MPRRFRRALNLPAAMPSANIPAMPAREASTLRRARASLAVRIRKLLCRFGYALLLFLVGLSFVYKQASLSREVGQIIETAAQGKVILPAKPRSSCPHARGSKKPRKHTMSI